MKSSYKGVQFFLENVNPSFENQINTYEIPGKEKVITENIGQTLSVYPVQGYSIGDDRDLVRDQLVAACRPRKPGILYIPSLGMLRAYCKKISIKDSFDEMGIVRFTMEFVEATDEETAIPYVDKVANTLQKIKKLKEELVGNLIEALALLDMPGQVLNSVISMLSQIIRLPSSSSGFRKNNPLDLVQSVEDFAEDFSGVLKDLLNEGALNIRLSLKGISKEFINFIDAAILEKLVLSVSEGGKLTRKQMERTASMASSIYSNTSNKPTIKTILDMLNNYPFLETFPIIPKTEIPSLIAIYQGGGDLNNEEIFLKHNVVDNPLKISFPVEVFID
jgi:hypothetical protein